MALRLGAVYEALRHAQGIPDDVAGAAAEELATMDQRLARIEADVRLLQWMIGTSSAILTALMFGNLWLSFNILSRLPR